MAFKMDKYNFVFMSVYFLMKAKIIPQMSTSLGIIANYFGIPEPKKHTSLGDAQCTIRVYQAQLNLLKNK